MTSTHIHLGPALRPFGLVLLAFVVACGTSIQRPDNRASSTTPTTVPTTAATTPSTTTTVPPTTTLSREQIDAAELEKESEAIVDLWRELSDIWSDGIFAGYQFIADHNHPSMGCNDPLELAAYYAFPEGTTSEFIVDQATIERDDGWSSRNALTDDPPRSNMYIFTLRSFNSFGDGTTSEQTLEVHTVIDEETGLAQFFIDCRE